MKVHGVFEGKSVAPLMVTIQKKSISMKSHRVFGMIKSIEDLRVFMEWHVFAVWDFMSLIKRLQIEFTSIKLPWTPPHNPEAARLINEIVLGEETDSTPLGTHLSHYELYLMAMEEIGSNTLRIKSFNDLVAANMKVEDAIEVVGVPKPIQDFVLSTVALAEIGTIEQVLGSFVFGREDAIPEMFQNLLNNWHIEERVAPAFVYYLQRHIQLDADEHGPAAMRVLISQVNGDEDRMVELLSAAVFAIEQRIYLWDALAAMFEQQYAAKKVWPQLLIYRGRK